MQTLPTHPITTEHLDTLDEVAETMPPELRDLLLSISRCVRDGDELAAFDEHASLTPNQAAQRLGMSRAHLYTLMDGGAVPFDRVGRDRRIRVRDLIAFENERHASRRELAERFARQKQTTRAAIDDVADLL